MKNKIQMSGSISYENKCRSSNFSTSKFVDCENFENGRSKEQKITFNELEEILDGIKINHEFMKEHGMIRNEKIYTNVAYLLSDQCEYKIKLNVFGGKSKIDFVDRTEFSGSVLKQCNDVCSYIINRFEDAFPIIALYEALSNSIVHRNYNYSGSIIVNIFTDKIEISSIGGLVGDMTIDDISTGISQPRNKLLSEFFYKYGTLVVCGSGINRIVESYHDKEKKPKFFVTNNVFVVILPNLIYADINMTNHERCIFEYLESNPFITRKTAEKILNVSQTMAGRVIKGLVLRGVLKQIGGSVNSKYYANF